MSDHIPCQACGEPATMRLALLRWELCDRHIDTLIGALLGVAAFAIVGIGILLGAIL